MDTPNVTNTPLSLEGRSLQPGLLSCKRGLSSHKSSLERAPDEAAILINLQQIRPGIWTSKGIGWSRQRTLAFNGASAFLDFAYFVNNLTGAKTMLFQVGTKVQSYDLNAATETDIITGLTATAFPTMRRAYSTVSGKSVVIYCNGDTEPKKITDITAAASGPLKFNGADWPGAGFNSKSYSKPALCEPFGNAMAYGKFNSATVAYDVLISDRGNPETFTISTPVKVTDAVAFTYPAELGQLTSMRSHRISNENTDEILICGCTDGIFIITGNSADTYSLKILNREVGILSNRAFIQVGDDLLFLSTSGIRTLSSVVNNAVLVPDTKSTGILDYINLIDTDNAYKAHAFHNPKTQEIQFWVPLTGFNGECRHAFVCSYNNEWSGAGSIFPVWSIKQGTGVSCSSVFKGACYGGGYDGLLQVHYSGDTYDGAPISFYLRNALLSLGNASQKTSVRNIGIVTEGGRQKFSIASYVISKKADGSWRRTQAKPGVKLLQALQAAATALGSWVLGQSAFPSEHLKVSDFQPRGNGPFWEVEVFSTASDDAIDYVATQFTLSGGSINR